MFAPAGPPRSTSAASLVTALSLARHSCELVARTRPAGCRPLLELGDELFVRYRHRRAPAARVPTPKHQLVLADVLERSEEHTSELQSPCNLVCRLLLEKKKKTRQQSSSSRST